RADRGPTQASIHARLLQSRHAPGSTSSPPGSRPARGRGPDACIRDLNLATVLAMSSLKCRFCGTALQDNVVDLGMSPLCETFLKEEELDRMEPFYPLQVWVCRQCYLVQLSEYVRVEEIFTEYAYFSSFSTAWLKHAEEYVAMISERCKLGP